MIPSLNLMALNAKGDADSKDTVRVKKESSDDEIEDEFIISDDSSDVVDVKEEPKPVEAPKSSEIRKKKRDYGAPDPRMYLKPSQIQKLQKQKGEDFSSQQKEPISARKHSKTESKIPEKKEIPKKKPISTFAGRTTAQDTNDNQEKRRIGVTTTAAAKQTTAKATKDHVNSKYVKETTEAVARAIKKASDATTPATTKSPVKTVKSPANTHTATAENKEIKETKKVPKLGIPPSCYDRPPSSRRRIEDTAVPSTTRDAATARVARKPAAGNGEVPSTSRKPAAARATPSDLDKRKDDSRIPATARTRKPVPITNEIDPMKESIRLRKESAKLFGDEFNEDLKDDHEWSELVEKENKLMINIKAGEIFDNSILNLYNEGSSKVVAKEGEDPFDVAMKELDAGFDAIHKQSMAEKELLEERALLLEQIRAGLVSDLDYVSAEK